MKTADIRICAALAAFLTAATVSCGDTTEQPNDSTAVTSTAVSTEADDTAAEDEKAPLLAQQDFEGYTFRFHNFDQYWNHMQLTADAENGDTLNDAIYRRNTKIEDYLNITITEFMSDTKALYRTVQAGDDACDAAYVKGTDITTFLGAKGGTPLYDFKTEVPHIDLTAPWWCAQANNDITIGNKQYFAANDISLSYFDSVMPIVMNLRLVNDFDLDDPYELVRNGKWTMDRVGEMMLAVTADLNGDGKYNADHDRFGTFGMSIEYTALTTAAGFNIIEKDENDLPYLAIAEDSFINAFAKATEILNQKHVFANYTLPQFAPTGDPLSTFSEGRSLFFSDVLFWISSLRNMEDDYAILPRAKYDEAQQDYYTVTECSGGLLCIPITADVDRSGYVIECLATESRNAVIPAYYDIVLCQKLARDEASIEMLDIVFDSRTADLGQILNPANVFSELRAMAENGKTNIASYAESVDKKVEKHLSKLIPED